MAWRLAKSLETLRTQLNHAYPNRSKVSDGTIGDAAHSATVSQHNPNKAGVVTAMDITHDPAHGVDGQALADQLIQDPRAWYVIFNNRIRFGGGNWQRYNGSNPHTKHVHLSVAQDPALYDNANKWEIGGKDMASDKTITNIARGLLFREPENSIASTLRPMTSEDALQYVINSEERDGVNKRWNSIKALEKENASLKAQLGSTDEANILGRALIKVLATLGYKKG